MVSRRALGGVVVVAALSIATGACSSSNKSSTGSTGSTGGNNNTAGSTTNSTPQSAGPSGSPIVVGEICSCSGAPGFSDFVVPAEKSIKAWADTVNASGGIAGHPIKLITKDDGTNPGTSATDAQTLLSDHVVAIIDNTTLDSSWGSTVAAAKIPVISTYSINQTDLTYPDFYPVGQTQNTTIAAVVGVAKAAGVTKIGDLYAAEAPSASASVPLMRSAGKAAGVPDVYDASISATAPNYTAQCLAAKQAGVDGLFIGDAPAVDDHVASDCASQGYSPVYLTEGSGFDMAQASSAAISKNLWSQMPDLPFFAKSPAVQAFNTAMDKYAPGVREDGNTFIQDDFMAWISAEILEEGIKAGGLTASATPSAAEITTGLNSLKKDTVGGLTPPLTFTAGQVHQVNCYYVSHVENGKPVMENNSQPTCIG